MGLWLQASLRRYKEALADAQKVSHILDALPPKCVAAVLAADLSALTYSLHRQSPLNLQLNIKHIRLVWNGKEAFSLLRQDHLIVTSNECSQVLGQPFWLVDLNSGMVNFAQLECSRLWS